MPVLTNVTINKVWTGKAGEGQYGPWQAYNFKVEGHDEKFGYFQSGSKPTPREGMVLELLQYETKQNGDYINHNVKKMDVASGGAAPAAGSQSPEIRGNGSGYQLAQAVKGYQIAYQGLGKFVGTPGATPEENHARIIAQYALMERWAQERAKAENNPAGELIKAIDAAGLGPHREPFERWLAAHYKKPSLLDLGQAEVIHGVIHLSKAIAKYREQAEAEMDLQRGEGIIGEPEYPPDEPEDVCPF